MSIARLILATAFAAAGLHAVPAQADALQNAVLATAKATPRDLFAFKRTLAFERPGAPRKVVVEQFDPRRPVAAQWTLVSIDGHPPTSKDIADARKRKREKAPSYAEIVDWFGAPATRSDTIPGYATYRFARLPAGTLKIGPHDASADTQAEALVNTKGTVPFVERVRLASTKSFTMMLVASLTSMVVDARYRLLPDGRAVPADTASVITGSMLGKSGQLRASVTYSDVQAVR